MTQSPDRDPHSPRFCLNTLMRKMVRISNGLYAEALRGSELQGTQFTLLVAISAFGEITVGELSDFLVMDQTTVTRSTALLKKGGYLTVEPGEDRRTRRLRLTEKGETAVAETYPLWLEAQQKLWAFLGQEQVDQLFTITDQLLTLDED